MTELQTRTKYTYDGNNMRVKKVSGSTTTVYLFSGSKVIAEYVNGAAPTAPTREYIYSGASLLAKIEAGATKYYHQDLLSNRMVTDSSGTVVAQIGHFPYGESWYNATGDKLLFTSYERDAESGNDYAQARYYVSRLGRFSAVDPLSGSPDNPQSLNRYVYVLDNPSGAVDPTGLCGDLLADPAGGAGEDCNNQFPGSGSDGWTAGPGYGGGGGPSLPPGCFWISQDRGTYSCAPNSPMPGQCYDILLDGFKIGNTCDPTPTSGSGNRNGGGNTSSGNTKASSPNKNPNPCTLQRIDSAITGAANLGLAIAKTPELIAAMVADATGVGAPVGAYGTISIFGQALAGSAQLTSAFTGNYGAPAKFAQVGNILSGPVTGLGTLAAGGSLSKAERNASFESFFTAGTGFVTSIKKGAAFALPLIDQSFAGMAAIPRGENACGPSHP